MQTLPELLHTMVQMEGSDLHITTNTPPAATPTTAKCTKIRSDQGF